jgi:uncharacterized protein YehS (DUF1456 family)
MDNNDIMRRLRYAFNISNSAMMGIFKLAGHDISESAVLDILKKEKDEGYTACSDRELELFLDGLIIQNRGKKETIDTEPIVKPEVLLSNNMVLKKLRIALDFKENDMLEMFKLSKFEITKPELTALFRKQGHKHYKACGDQMMRNFLQGLTVHFRK